MLTLKPEVVDFATEIETMDKAKLRTIFPDDGSKNEHYEILAAQYKKFNTDLTLLLNKWDQLHMPYAEYLQTAVDLKKKLPAQIATQILVHLLWTIEEENSDEDAKVSAQEEIRDLVEAFKAQRLELSSALLAACTIVVADIDMKVTEQDDFCIGC